MVPLLAVLLVAAVSGVLYQPLHSDNAILATNQNVLLLTAHPDDEAMFFAPTLLALTSQAGKDAYNAHLGDEETQKPLSTASGSNVFSLCLSVGDADGLGAVRPNELHDSLDILGVSRSNRWIVDHPKLQDNMSVFWDADTIAQVIKPYVVDNHISTILTFDKGGISSHPNHQALPEGAKELLLTMDSSTRPRLFTLITVPVAGKYTSVLAAVMAKWDLFSSKAFQLWEYVIISILEKFEFVPAGSADEPTDHTKNILPVFISGVPQYKSGFEAMLAHKSQLVWFRWLYLFFSRYMWINEWTEVKL